MTDRKVITPGEIIAEGENYLPGDGTERRGNAVVALRFGLVEEQNNLIKVIPLSGVYSPRRGNVIIGKVTNVTFNGWVIDIGCAENAFLPLMEVPRFVNKNALEEVMDINDAVVIKIIGINKRGIDVTIKARGLGRIEGGMLLKINPHKVPRVIGKEGSMISLIKEKTNTNITVGQNGFVLVIGDTTEDELKAKKAILFITEKSYVEGLTEKVNEWFEENGK